MQQTVVTSEPHSFPKTTQPTADGKQDASNSPKVLNKVMELARPENVMGVCATQFAALGVDGGRIKRSAGGR